MKITINRRKIKTLLGIIAIFTLATIALLPIQKTEAAGTSCSLVKSNNNDIIVSLSGQTLVAMDIPGYSDISSTQTNIPAGQYKITVETWDGHSTQNGANSNQTKESLFLNLYHQSNLLFQTADTYDIPEYMDNRITVVSSKVDLIDNVTEIISQHSYYGYSNNAESVAPVCAKFERLDQEEPKPTKPAVQCNISATKVKVGEKVNFSADVSGGEYPYEYDWNGAIDGYQRTTSHRFYNPGVYNVSVKVTDDNNNSDTDNCSPIVVEEDYHPADLDVQCIVSDNNVEIGDRVYFEAIVSGGEYPYEYDWNGDVNGYQRRISEIFYDDGRYYSSVTVTDENGNSASDTCSTVYVEEDNDDEDFEIQCEISDTTIDEGDRVTISVDIDGGNSPFDIQWSGDDDEIDDFDDNDRSQRVTIDEDGRYRLKVTVEDDDGNRRSDSCPTIYVGKDDDEQITVFTSTINTPNKTYSGLSSVYLNQVPYTGSEDVAKVLGFISLILIWSAIVAYYFLGKRNRKLISKKIAEFKKANLARKLG